MNAAILAKGLGISGQTVARCHVLLVYLMLMRRRMPWFENTGKLLVNSPKVYVCDIGLTHALLNLETTKAPLGHSVVGGNWEGFCLENLIAAAPLGGEAFIYRSASRAEIGLVLRLASGAVWAIEIKRTTSPKVSRGFHEAADIGATVQLMVHAGALVPGKDGLMAMPLSAALKQLRGLS